jgi:hypothetical protein
VIGEFLALALFYQQTGPLGFGEYLERLLVIITWRPTEKEKCTLVTIEVQGPVIEFSTMMKESKQTNQCVQYAYVCH